MKDWHSVHEMAYFDIPEQTEKAINECNIAELVLNILLHMTLLHELHQLTLLML